MARNTTSKRNRSSRGRDTAAPASGHAIEDFRTAVRSRQVSLLGRKEVFTGKAKFGIFGDGKEVAQVAMARAMSPGDIRSGYYRDQTVMMALGLLTAEQFFAQLYAHTDLEAEPASGGRQMTGHFATRMLDAEGRWLDLTGSCQSSADVSPTGSQMPRLVGLGQASKLYRALPGLESVTGFSDGGNEIAWGTIGNASCAEGVFWEALNAIGVLQAPVVVSVWDDEYGISVPNDHQITGTDLTRLFNGFGRDETGHGFETYRVYGWDYPALCETYRAVAGLARERHVPSVIHVVEVTQPQGHSTSGSHERYKSKERLEWEARHDCILRMRRWLLEQGIADEAQLDAIERDETDAVAAAKDRAWNAYIGPVLAERDRVLDLLDALADASGAAAAIRAVRDELARRANPFRRDLVRAAHDALVAAHGDDTPARRELIEWRDGVRDDGRERYGSHLYSETDAAALRVEAVDARYDDDAPTVRGFEVLNACFDRMLERDPRVVAFGEDVGQLGDVNQGFSGLQEKYGVGRVFDTGIREATILGQGIGLAMRGLRPIVEIQYLDYVLYALQIMSDDLATVRYRTKGGQMAPVIVRTRGHRLEGIWHSGSPMAGIINLVRGVHVCVPRDMTQAAGFYNTLLASDDPGLIIEVLNGYRLKERLPSNVGEMRVPLGVPEVLREGRDVTVVTYGACCRIALEAAEALERVGIEVEVIDVQTLLPFDRDGRIVESLKKTARVVFLDEDVPGGTTAYMMREVLEVQGGYWWLDSEPVTLPARPHRPAYGSDGDYWSKPNRETVFEAVYALMREADPGSYPDRY